MQEVIIMQQGHRGILQTFHLKHAVFHGVHTVLTVLENFAEQGTIL
jgi:hypothetical protein